jgi:hypothetical protein
VATVNGAVQVAKALNARLRQGCDTPLAQQLRASIAEKQGRTYVKQSGQGRKDVPMKVKDFCRRL